MVQGTAPGLEVSDISPGIHESEAIVKAAIGFAVACWLSGAILMLADSTAAIALSGALALAGLDLFAP